MDDKHARDLLDRATRIAIYRQLNPCAVEVADNCPAAAQAMFDFLRHDGPAPGNPPGPNARPRRTSIVPAICNEVGQGFVIDRHVSFQRAASLEAIVQTVNAALPGNVVVVHGRRPPGAVVNGRAMAPDHYFCLVKVGPPQNDVFWADCSRPALAIFYPSQATTRPGGWEDTISSFARHNQLRSFSYTRGPYSVHLGPTPRLGP